MSIVAVVLAIGIICVSGRSSGPPRGCILAAIFPSHAHNNPGTGDGGFRLCMKHPRPIPYTTIMIDQSNAPAKIKGFRLRPSGTQGYFLQNFNRTLFGDVNGGNDCVHHLMKLDDQLGDHFHFEFVATAEDDQQRNARPIIQFDILAGSGFPDQYWTGLVEESC